MKENEFRRQSLWSDLEETSHVLESIDALGDTAVSARLDEVRELLAFTKSFKESDDFMLFSPTMVSQPHADWVTIRDQLTTYKSSPVSYSNYLDSAVVHLNQTRDHLALWPRAQGSPAARAALTRGINSYRDALAASREALKTKLEDIVAAAEVRESNLKKEIELLETQLALASASVEKLDARITKDEIRLDTALTTNNETFITGQSTREKSFKEWLSEQETDFGDLAKPHVDSVIRAATVAAEHLAVVTKLRTSTVDMSNLAAGDILADQYAAYAQSERKSSYIAYAFGALAALGSIAIILIAFGWIASGIDWPTVVLKLGLTAAAGGVAAVAFRFGGQAVRRATSFKREELELRALQPFLEDVEGADEAKTAFLERAFGHAWAETATGKSEPEMNDALLKLLTLTVQNFSKAGTS